MKASSRGRHEAIAIAIEVRKNVDRQAICLTEQSNGRRVYATELEQGAVTASPYNSEPSVSVLPYMCFIYLYMDKYGY